MTTVTSLSLGQNYLSSSVPTQLALLTNLNWLNFGSQNSPGGITGESGQCEGHRAKGTVCGSAHLRS